MKIQTSKKLKRSQSYLSKVERSERKIEAIELGDFTKIYDKDINYFIKYIMNILSKTLGRLFIGGEVKRGRIKGNYLNYSISFEDTQLPWKKTNSAFKKSYNINSDSNAYTIIDEFFISTAFEKISQALLAVKIIDVNKYIAGVVADMQTSEEHQREVLEELLNLEALGKASIVLQRHVLVNKVIHIMSIVTSENLKDNIKREIEKIAYSLRFEINEDKFLINALLDFNEKSSD